MNSKRQCLSREFDLMKIGQYITVDRRIFQEAYPCGWPSIYRDHREAFLSSRIGSAWGCWTCEQEFTLRGDYRIGRHEEGPRRIYVDPDREHLYKRLPSGEFVHNPPLPGGVEFEIEAIDDNGVVIDHPWIVRRR